MYVLLVSFDVGFWDTRLHSHTNKYRMQFIRTKGGIYIVED